MKAGEMSQVIEMKDKTCIVLLCERHLSASPVRVEDERVNLHREIFEMKLAQKISEHVAELRRQASPRLLLARQPSIEQVERDAADFLKETQDLTLRARPVGSN